MSATTYTASIIHQTVFGNKRIHVVKYTITSYGTEGIPVSAAVVGMANIDTILGVIQDVANDVTNGPVQALWNPATFVITFIKASDTLVDDAVALIVYVTVMGD